MKPSLLPGLLNYELERFLGEKFPALLDKLGFRTKAAGVLLAAAMLQMRGWTAVA